MSHRRVAFAKEHQEDQAEGIQRGEQYTNDACRPQPCAALARTPGPPQNEILAEIPRRDKRKSSERTSADQKCPERNRQFPAEPTHAENIVLVMERLDDDPRRQE